MKSKASSNASINQREDLRYRPFDVGGARGSGSACEIARKGGHWRRGWLIDSVLFRVGRILCPSVMVNCNKHSDGSSSAARKGGIWCKEDAATRRAKKRWFGRNSGVKVVVMVDLDREKG